MMWTDKEKAFCVEAYISTKSFGKARLLFLKKFSLDHRRLELAPSKTCIKNCWINLEIEAPLKESKVEAVVW